ncbi:CapA family protein [Temperatibacter marinus]|uniref:CapA family protein n=1 Tax=Temperatibacter marinus TaxID=1456591 RepID=A0AA52EFF9_9PROT|nr:CapA family protein [Temperatibacter marinus]WND01855.1 CapA family protein [Temperatibacter marinus]
MTEIEGIMRSKSESGEWSTPQDLLFDPTDMEFMAYWLYKSYFPYTTDRPGSKMKRLLGDTKGTEFTLLPSNMRVEDTLSMSAVGDLMFAVNIERSKDRLYQAVNKVIFDHDIRFANLESTLTSESISDRSMQHEGDTPHINITQDEYKALVHHKKKSFNLLQLANNHIMDCGEEGARLTLSQLDKDNILGLGVFLEKSEADRPQITEHKGVKIGWVSHTFSLNQQPTPEGKPWMVNVTDFHCVETPNLSQIDQQIKACKKEGADLVFLSLHWGLEHEFFPHPDQQKWAHQFAEWGADLIIGHHPHVIQPIEVYRPTSSPDRTVPILYSLGNLTPGYGAAATVLSLIAEIEIARGSLEGQQVTRLQSIRLTPTAFMAAEEGGEEISVLEKLSKLVEDKELCPDSKNYVEQMAGYADLILGASWR